MGPEGPQNFLGDHPPPPPLSEGLDPPLILMQARIEVVLGYDCCVMIHDS